MTQQLNSMVRSDRQNLVALSSALHLSQAHRALEAWR